MIRRFSGAALGFNLASLPLRWPGRLLASTDVLFTHAPAFAALRTSMTPQDRTLIVTDIGTAASLRLMQKSASVMRVATAHDYEALLGYRFSRYFMLAWEQLMPRIRTRRDALQVTPAHHLFDLAAVRYVVVSDQKRSVAGFRPAQVQGAGLQLLVNDAALPRALYVPVVEVIADADAMLRRLSGDSEALRTRALVDTPRLPASSATHRAAVLDRYNS